MTARTSTPRHEDMPGPHSHVRPRGWIRRELTAVRVVWERELLRSLRSPGGLVLTLLQPLLFLVVLGTGLSRAVPDVPGDYRTFLFPGMLVMAVQFPAIAAGASIVWDREMGFLREMLVAPVRRESLLAGKCLGGATVATGTGGVVLALAGIAGVPYDPLLLAVLLAQMALAAFALTTLGALCAVCISRPETFQTVLTVAMLPLLFLSGAFFPLASLPGWIAVPALANPLSYAVDALRRTMAAFEAGPPAAAGPMWGTWQPPVALELGMVLLLAAVALAAASRRFGRPS